jgi:hypothetical protein
VPSFVYKNLQSKILDMVLSHVKGSKLVFNRMDVSLM